MRASLAALLRAAISCQVDVVDDMMVKMALQILAGLSSGSLIFLLYCLAAAQTFVSQRTSRFHGDFKDQATNRKTNVLCLSFALRACLRPTP